MALKTYKGKEHNPRFPLPFCVCVFNLLTSNCNLLWTKNLCRTNMLEIHTNWKITDLQPPKI